jgi:hypothetical protein
VVSTLWRKVGAMLPTWGVPTTRPLGAPHPFPQMKIKIGFCFAHALATLPLITVIILPFANDFLF